MAKKLASIVQDNAKPMTLNVHGIDRSGVLVEHKDNYEFVWQTTTDQKVRSINPEIKGVGFLPQQYDEQNKTITASNYAIHLRKDLIQELGDSYNALGEEFVQRQMDKLHNYSSLLNN